MDTFKQFLEARHWRDWPPEDYDNSMYDQQDKDWNELKELIDDFNRRNRGTEELSVSHAGDHENPRDSDNFILYSNQEEVTNGSLQELIAKVKQIRKEYGEF